MELNGKQVLITGAASGIGRATAQAAARKGARLLLTDIDDARLQATALDIRRAGGIVEHVGAMDVSDHDAVVAFADEIHAEHGSLDVVMNIAGVSAWGSVENLSHEQWRRMIDINLMGPIHVIECVVPRMIAAGRGGHLVNVSSAAGLFGLPWHAAYSASKFGLRGVSEVLRFDLARHRIGVSLVCPGAVRTPLVDTVEIAGVDRANPRVARMVKRFEAHAVSPESVAQDILRAVQRDRYLVFTSRDIRALHLLQRVCEPGYALIMRVLNHAMTAVARNAPA